MNCFGLLVVGAIRSEPLGSSCWGFPYFLTWVNSSTFQIHTRTQTEHTESKVASTKGQQSTVFRPRRYSYFNVASWSLYDTLRVRGCWFAGKEKKPLGIAESREKVRKRKCVVFCNCLVAHAYRSSTTLIKLSCLCCKSLADSNRRRLLSLPLQAKTTSELRYISLAPSWDGNKFWFALTVVWLQDA